MPKRIPQSAIPQIKKLAGKLPIDEIAVKLKISRSSVILHAGKMGVSLQTPEKIDRAKLISKTVKEKHTEMTVTEISNMLGVPYNTIRYHGNVLEVVFKQYHEPSKDQKEIHRGEFFNEGARSNWLI